jgi:hypothetical protein
MERLARAISDTATNDFRDLDKTFDQYLFSPLNMAAARTVSNLSYLKQYWLDGDSPHAYFTEFQPVAPIMAMGILKVIEESLKGQPQPKPIDAWWIIDHIDFEVISLVSSQQVTMLLATPRPPHFPTGIWSPTAEGYTTGLRGVVTRKF